MAEEKKKPNPFGNIENPDNIRPGYATGHFVGQTDNEFLVCFFQRFPPDTKNIILSKTILNEKSLRTLYLGIGASLKALDNKRKKDDEEPPKRP